MKSKTRLAALRILALREEFSVEELRGALSLAGEWSSTVAPMAKRHETSPGAERTPSSAITESESRVVTELRDRDPERYSILSKIDRAMRLGRMLPRMSDIQRAGSSLDKEFDGGKSKGVAIPRLMAKLAGLPLGELERVYQAWKQGTRSDRRPNTEYDDLAEFLIRGRIPRTSVSVD